MESIQIELDSNTDLINVIDESGNSQNIGEIILTSAGTHEALLDRNKFESMPIEVKNSICLIFSLGEMV